jgi:hypothetical protein
MKITPAVVLMAYAATTAGCWAGEYETTFDQYFQRSDTITPGAGNAKEVNAAIHVIDPWRRYSGNRRIPANGARMTGAIQRYRANQSGRPDAPAGQPGATTGGASISGSSTPASSSQ